MTVRSPRATAIVVATAVVIVLTVVLVGVVALTSRDAPAGSQAPTGAAPSVGGQSDGPVPVVRDDSHVLGPPGDGSVTMVEFLDFECEACAALYPFYEELRKLYSGKVRFVARYFPIPSHANAMNAAVAVEAAAQQGYFEQMYARMYETQGQWGERQESMAGLFRTWAQQLGLDMAKFDAAVADPATTARVERDRDDGVALGVAGTPTLFLNGRMLELSNGQQLMDEIDAALAGS